MPTQFPQCPDSQILADFLLGKLPSGVLDACRLHLADCDPCVETIRGLKIDGDTINDLSQAAWLGESPTEPSESQVIEGLIKRMEGLSTSNSGDRFSKIQMAEDRAPEVQRLLDPAKFEGEAGQLGHYRIVELLCAGSTGVVYQAIDERLNRTVAVKILRPSLGESARDRFMAEARATAMLNHPNIVPFF
ncbi:MAG: hypothetical protein ACI87E_001445 [Mariniblastus sp.]|jgi:hypothetical protein